jgi:hypothetical protein
MEAGTGISVTYGMEGAGSLIVADTMDLQRIQVRKNYSRESDPRLLVTILHMNLQTIPQAYGRAWFNRKRRFIRGTNDGVGNGKAFETPESGINYRVLRFSNVYLMYAEALNELNRTARPIHLFKR